MSNFLVFGGAGFLGAATIRWLLENGHHVRTVVRHPDKIQAFVDQGVEVWQGDVLDRDSIRGCAEGMDYATYSVVVRSQDPMQMVPLHLQAVGNVIDELDGTIKGFALASGTSVYEFDDGEWHDESEKPNATGPIGQLNIASEGMLYKRHAETGFPGTVVRIAGVYGAGRMMAARLRNGEMSLAGDGSNYTNRIHVDDAGQAMALAAIKGKRGEAYIAVDDSPITLKELYETMQAVTGGPGVRWTPIPADLSQLSVMERMMLSVARSVRFRNDKAKQDLGFSPKFPDCREVTQSEVAAELESEAVLKE